MISKARSNFNTLATEYQLMFTILMFNIVDFFTTKVLIDRHGRYDIESNVALYNAMVLFDSVWVILIAKLAFIAFAWWMLFRFYKPEQHLVVKVALYIVLIAGLAISIFNFGLIALWQ